MHVNTNVMGSVFRSLCMVNNSMYACCQCIFYGDRNCAAQININHKMCTENAEWRLLSPCPTGNNEDSISSKGTLGESGVQSTIIYRPPWLVFQ